VDRGFIFVLEALLILLELSTVKLLPCCPVRKGITGFLTLITSLHLVSPATKKIRVSGTCISDAPLYDYRMLSLTRCEQLVLLLVLFALTAGAGIRHFRLMHSLPQETPLTTASR